MSVKSPEITTETVREALAQVPGEMFLLLSRSDWGPNGLELGISTPPFAKNSETKGVINIATPQYSFVDPPQTTYSGYKSCGSGHLREGSVRTHTYLLNHPVRNVWDDPSLKQNQIIVGNENIADWFLTNAKYGDVLHQFRREVLDKYETNHLSFPDMLVAYKVLLDQLQVPEAVYSTTIMDIVATERQKLIDELIGRNGNRQINERNLRRAVSFGLQDSEEVIPFSPEPSMYMLVLLGGYVQGQIDKARSTSTPTWRRSSGSPSPPSP